MNDSTPLSSDSRKSPDSQDAAGFPPRKSAEASFAEAAEAPEPGIVREFVDFLATSKKWWLTPIIVVLLLVAGLVLLAGSPAGPFLYSLW